MGRTTPRRIYTGGGNIISVLFKQSKPPTMSASNYATACKLNYFHPPADGSRAYINFNADSVTGERARNWAEDLHLVDIENGPIQAR